MIFHLFCLLIGYCKITLAGSAEAAATFFLRQKINVAKQTKGKDGSLSFLVPLYEKRRLQRLLAANRFEIVSTENGGLPAFLWRFRLRIGLLLGGICAMLIIFAGSRVLWEVRIVGCNHLSEEHILELLAEEGVEVGSSIPPIDAKKTALHILLKEKQIAYLAINIIGTVCEVQVTEAVFPQESEAEDYPASIVAAEDGLIERVEVYDGQLAVKAGEAVRAGSVLISGLCDGFDGAWRLTRASGKVIAKVEREFVVEVPFTEERLQKNGEESVAKSLIFFKKSIKLFETSSILTPTYDTIESKDALTLPSGLVLPIAISTTRQIGYEKVTLSRTVSEAEALARKRMEALTADALRDAELLTLSQTMEHTEDGVKLIWKVYCLTDIAKTLPMVGLPN